MYIAVLRMTHCRPTSSYWYPKKPSDASMGLNSGLSA